MQKSGRSPWKGGVIQTLDFGHKKFDMFIKYPSETVDYTVGYLYGIQDGVCTHKFDTHWYKDSI